MTIVFNSDYTEATITSDLITNWLGIVDNEEVLTLSIHYQCTDTPVEITLDSSNLNVGTESYTLLPSSLSQGTTFLDGVYFFVIENEDTIETETECKLIDQELECKVNSYISENLTSNIRMLYDALLNLEQCSDCKCVDACTIYEHIINTVDGTTLVGKCNDC